MTTLVLPDAAPSGPPPQPPGEQLRFVSVTANLLPDEIVAARRARQTMRKVVMGLVALVVLLAAWYGSAVWATHSAKSNLAGAQRQSIKLQNKVRSYGPLVEAQSESAAITKSLTQLMARDLPWTGMIATLVQNEPNGVKLTGVDGKLDQTGTSGGGVTAGLGVLNQSGKLQVGTLTINGTAPDKNSIAAYVDKLATVKGLAAPFVASLSGKPGQLTFSVSVLLTSDALGGRFAPKSALVPLTGGK